MDGLLETINEQYIEELAKIFPLHRVLIALIALPPFLNVVAGHPGAISFSYANWSLRQLVGPETSVVPQQSVASLLLFAVVVLAAIFGALAIQWVIASLLFRSRWKAQYLVKIRESGSRLLGLTDDGRDETAKALRTRYLALRKSVMTKTRLSEILYSYFVLWLIFSRSASEVDCICALVTLGVGLLLQVDSYRYYLTKVAPPYLLWAMAAGQLVELDDGM